MRHFLDCEFIERGPRRPVELISIAVVAEDGREFYAVSTDFRARHANDWVKANVLPLLPERNPTPPPYGSPRQWQEAARWMPRDQIADKLLPFIGDDRPEFWGWCAGFDYVLLCQLFGGMSDYPSHWPYHINDLQQEADRLGLALPSQSGGQHDALADARHIASLWSWLQTPEPTKGRVE